VRERGFQKLKRVRKGSTADKRSATPNPERSDVVETKKHSAGGSLYGRNVEITAENRGHRRSEKPEAIRPGVRENRRLRGRGKGTLVRVVIQGRAQLSFSEGVKGGGEVRERDS